MLSKKKGNVAISSRVACVYEIMRTHLGIISFLLGILFFVTVFYQGFVTVFAQLVFSESANGSQILIDNKIKGSVLLAQEFDKSRYFYPRPSMDRHPLTATGSSEHYYHSSFKKRVFERWNFLSIEQQALTSFIKTIPSDVLLSSASGLDPHLSLNSVYLQVPRVAEARKMTENQIIEIIKKHIENKVFFIWGQERVNVMKLNLFLDSLSRL